MFSGGTVRACGRVHPVMRLNSLCHLVSPCSGGKITSLVCITPRGRRTIFFKCGLMRFVGRRVPHFHVTKLSPVGGCHFARLGLPVNRRPYSLRNGIVSKRVLVRGNIRVSLHGRCTDHIFRLSIRWVILWDILYG